MVLSWARGLGTCEASSSEKPRMHPWPAPSVHSSIRRQADMDDRAVRRGRQSRTREAGVRSGQRGSLLRRRMERAGRTSAIGRRPRCRHKLDNRVQARGKRARQNEQAAAVKRSHRSIRQRSSPAWAEPLWRVRWQRHRARFRAPAPEGGHSLDAQGNTTIIFRRIECLRGKAGASLGAVCCKLRSKLARGIDESGTCRNRNIATE
jgi:hypothetical protein